MRHPVLCPTCEGTGRIAPHPYSFEWDCPDGCTNGYFEATARDLDGKIGRYRYMYGELFLLDGVLCIQDDKGQLVVNLQPEDVEIL